MKGANAEPRELFPSLWCRENEFQEREKGPFTPLKSRAAFHHTLICTPQLEAVLTLDGDRTSLGVIRIGEVEVRAFGPENGILHFGIEGRGMDGWARSAADPEVWLEMKSETEGEGLRLNFKFVGVRPEKPLSFAFYIKAKLCEVQKNLLYPKSLHRFVGEAQEVCFNQKCLIETPHPHRLQVIPLAGEGCFWNTDFLLSYPIGSFTSHLPLIIRPL